jgi:hypothetical protein
MLFRLQKESGGYLSVEVIGESVDDVVKRFEAFARAKCKRSGGTWADDEIEAVRNAGARFKIALANEDYSVLLGSMFQQITPGVTVDGEMFSA